MAAIHSMTGFGRCERITDSYRILAELRSVNHRYLELSVRMPRRLNCFEAKLREILKEYMERGKADICLSYEDYTGGGRKLNYNEALAKEYVAYAAKMSETFGIPNDLKAVSLMRMPDILTMEEAEGDNDALWQAIEPVLREAASSFCDAREKEGARLREDLLGKLEKLRSLTETIETASPSVVEAYRKRLSDKIRETLSDAAVCADEGRIVTEVAIYADKICTDEEMVRLKSHIAAMQKKLTAGGACGRELDFIAQEMNREANTTLSKANSLSIADTAIALKTEIEKIREQVQNIE